MEAKGGEVRRLHIIYFLSHMGGHADQPHLIRVLHLARNGVYLRDVKRWLGDLRGKDMPEAFAWSYKRLNEDPSNPSLLWRYKTGFVWQDLLDDDLITPVSDNEYVLKGSQIHPSPFETTSLDEKKTVSDIMAEKESPQAQVVEDKQQQQQQPSPSEEEPQIQRNPDSKTDTPTKGSSEISQDSLVFSSERSSVTDDYSSKVEEEKLLGTGKECFNEQNHHEKKLENCSLPSLYHNLLSKKGSKIDQNKTSTPDDSSFSTASSSSSSQSSFAKIISNSTRVSKAFRNWIYCGNAETNDAALVLVKGSHKNVFKDTNNIPDNKAEICRGDKLGGSARCFGTTWIHHHQQKQQYGARKSFDGEETNRSRKTLGEFMNIQKPYKPFGGPTCSQCGKTFKPEKMHKHMKSCKGMKAVGTSAATAEKTQLQKSPTSTCEDHLLTN